MDLVFIHGRAATGKLTTARELSRLVGYPVFHNHLVVDLLTTVFPFGTESFVALRERMWLDVFAHAARDDRSLIFTFTPEGTVTEGFPDRVRATVDSSGGEVHFVQLRVGDREQERRVTRPSRTQFHKLATVEGLRRAEGQPAVGELPPVDLDIDTEHSSAAASAATIVDHFRLAPRAPEPRYPA